MRGGEKKRLGIRKHPSCSPGTSALGNNHIGLSVSAAVENE